MTIDLSATFSKYAHDMYCAVVAALRAGTTFGYHLSLYNQNDYDVSREILMKAHDALIPIVGAALEPLTVSQNRLDAVRDKLTEPQSLVFKEDWPASRINHMFRAVHFSSETLYWSPPLDEHAYKAYAEGLAGLSGDLYHATLVYEDLLKTMPAPNAPNLPGPG